MPEIVTPRRRARVMDLARPDPQDGQVARVDGRGILYLLDPPDVVRRKIARAVTDSDVGRRRRAGPDRGCQARGHQPARHPRRRAADPGGRRLPTYGALKAAVTDAVVADARAAAEDVRRAGRRPRARRPRLRARRGALPRGDRAGPGRRPDGDRPGVTRDVMRNGCPDGQVV